MADIHALARKHRIAPEAIVSHHAVLAKELDEIRGQEFRIDALEAALAQALVCFESEASMLSEARHASAKSLAAKVQAQLHTLGMENCHFNIDLTPSCGDPERNGRERVEFLISTLPGSPLGPLSRVASGGELSRISLAIQVVTAETTSIPTIVFDEVDVGIGAGVAAIVGRLMRRLGERGQVLCVTHLAQVAACGHHHILVSKEKTPLGLTACLQSLNTRARIEEIARMLGGRKLTKTSRQHAEELLDLEQNPAD